MRVQKMIHKRVALGGGRAALRWGGGTLVSSPVRAFVLT